MDENLAKLNRIYPNCSFVKIPKYNPEQWKNTAYDSSLDSKGPASGRRWSTNPLTYEEAQQAVSEGYRVGWIVPTGYVIIDIDNKDDKRSQDYVERLLQKFEVQYSYNYSSKGVHILLKDDSHDIKSTSRVKCSLNVLIDTRANGTGYIVLPCNDPHREWGKWNDVVESIPYFLKPLMSDNTPTFIGMQNGDGRNDALWKWRAKLIQSHKLSENEIEKSIRIINENFFSEPMTNPELFKTVLRKIDEDKIKAKEPQDDIYEKLANDIIGKYDIVSYYNELYMFNGSYYKPILPMELEKIIHSEIDKNVRRSGRVEILEFIKLKTQVSIEDFNKEWYKIACSNGVINLVTGELEPANKTEINTIFIPWAYDSDPEYSPRIDQFMKEVTGGDVVKMQFLYQIAGYCLLKKNIFQKFVIFKGEGGTGKSTYMNLLNKMLGDHNCAHIGIGDFSKDYYIATCVSKLVNIDDDAVDGKVLENTGRFKSIISGDIISTRDIYKEVISFIPFCTCVFSCNKLPRIMDRTSGLYRRMILIELNNKVLHPDPLFLNKITASDIQYFLFKAVQGIKMAIEEGRLRISQSEQQLLQLFKRRQSPLNEWLYENDVKLGDLHRSRVSAWYSQFNAWAEDSGFKHILTKSTFEDDICTLYDIELRFEKYGDGKIPAKIFYKPGKFDEEFRPFGDK